MINQIINYISCTVFLYPDIREVGKFLACGCSLLIYYVISVRTILKQEDRNHLYPFNSWTIRGVYRLGLYKPPLTMPLMKKALLLGPYGADASMSPCFEYDNFSCPPSSGGQEKECAKEVLH